TVEGTHGTLTNGDYFAVEDRLTVTPEDSLSSGDRIVLSHDPSGTALATTTVEEKNSDVSSSEGKNEEDSSTLSLSVTFENTRAGASTFYINHIGGNSVKLSDLNVTIGGLAANDLDLTNGSETFSVGKRLKVETEDNMNEGDRIVLIHESSGTALGTTTVD
ncbi:MAG: hypothetical protein ACLFUR_04305, partial [Candidatus Hadarchaeia archaeon]